MTVTEAAAGPNPRLRSALFRQWMKACGIVGDPGSVHVAELLPHYAKLLSLLDNMHSSNQVEASTVMSYLSTLRVFLVSNWQIMQGASNEDYVDYAAMLRDVSGAYNKHYLMCQEQGSQQLAGGLGHKKCRAAVQSVQALMAAAAQPGRSCIDAAAAAAAADPEAAAAAAAAAVGLGDSILYVDLQGGKPWVRIWLLGRLTGPALHS
jgi:hypothetical protein